MHASDIPLELTEKDYQSLREFIYRRSGIHLHEGKKELLKARLSRYLPHSNFHSIEEYCRFLVKHENGEECINLLDSVSTNLTYFFREPRHYDFLLRKALPELTHPARNRNQKKIDLWSAGCSSGEEAYSLAMTIMEYFGASGEWEWNILASDISTKMLKKAKEAIYPTDKVGKIPIEFRRRYFQKGDVTGQGSFKIKPRVRRHIQFERMNLVEPFPRGLSSDIIFCRNVMIYFDRSTREELVNKFYAILSEQGFLFVGRAESLTGILHPFKFIRPGIYQKPSGC
jgi:chemotaxis protein methyltransferase CheR